MSSSRSALFSLPAVLSALLLVGCASTTVEQIARIEQEGRSLGFTPVRFGAAPPLAAMLKTDTAHPPSEAEDAVTHALWIVIEGDGRAWLNRHQPSPDPTPRDAVGWRLAKDLSAHNVLYLARPCQYLSSPELAGCTIDDWTDGRFSEKWVARTNAAIDAAKITNGFSHVVLTGYSGGGVMAALIAARRADALALITVAAPLDHAAWTAWHGVSPLTHSLSVIAVRHRLLQLPQLFISGADDDIVPSALTRAFLRGYPAGVPAGMVTLPGVDHRMRAAIDLRHIKSSTLPWQSVDDQDSGRALPDRNPPQ